MSQEALISCICPTYNRRDWLTLAIKSFVSQTYSKKELVICDNGDDGTEDLVAHLPFVRYHKLSGAKLNHGEMMNAVCQLASGEILTTWDSDDFSMPGRLQECAAFLTSSSSKTVCGYSTVLYYDTDNDKAYRYSYDGPRDYATGTSQMFYKSYWESQKFRPIPKGCDSVFAINSYGQGKLITTPGLDMIVARAHKDSAAPPHWQAHNYKELPKESIPKQFWEALWQCQK